MPISSSFFPPWNLQHSEGLGAEGQCLIFSSQLNPRTPTPVPVGRCLHNEAPCSHPAPHAHQPGNEVRDAEFRQRLPSLDETHLGLNEAHLGDVLVGLQDPRRELCSETSASGTGLTAALPAPRSPHWEQYGSARQRNGRFYPKDTFLLFGAQ